MEFLCKIRDKYTALEEATPKPFSLPLEGEGEKAEAYRLIGI